MGACGIGEEDRRLSNCSIDLSSQYMGGALKSTDKISQTVLVTDRTTKVPYIQKTIYTESKETPNAQSRVKTFEVFDILRKQPDQSVVLVKQISTFSGANNLQIVEEAAVEPNWHTLRSIVNRQKQNGGSFSERAVGNLAFQLLHALKHINSLNLVHGSINMDNIMCSQKNIEKTNIQFKLVNFDNARLLPASKLPALLDPKDKKDLRSPFCSPELADQDLKKFGFATDIWSFGMLIFTMLTGFEPLDDPAQSYKVARQSFEEETELLNGEYADLLGSDDCKTFLRECIQKDPQSRFPAENLLKMNWVVDLQKEKKEFYMQQMKVRTNFAAKMKSNYAALKYASSNEWALLKNLIANGCLDDELDSVQETFYGIDINDKDGKVSFDEILDIAKESGFFEEESTPDETPGDQDEEPDVKISLQDLEGLFSKIDLNKNGTLDMTEFMLIAGDRSIIFGEQNMLQLFNCYDGGEEGEIAVDDVKELFRLKDENDEIVDAEGENEDFVTNYLADNFEEPTVDFNQFKVILRDIAGLNNLQIEEDEEAEEEEEYVEEQEEDEEAPQSDE